MSQLSTVLHYQDNGQWMTVNNVLGWNMKIGNIAQLIDSRGPSAGEELYAIDNSGYIWEYEYSSPGWTPRGTGLPGTMAASSNGINVIGSGGVVEHLQDNAKEMALGGQGMTWIVSAPNGAGHEEVFAKNANGSLWAFNFDTWSWHGVAYNNLAGATIVPSQDGIDALINGSVWHYSDDAPGNWGAVGGNGFTSIVSSRDSSGHEVVFAQLANGQTWVFNYATWSWTYTGTPILG